MGLAWFLVLAKEKIEISGVEQVLVQQEQEPAHGGQEAWAACRGEAGPRSPHTAWPAEPAAAAGLSALAGRVASREGKKPGLTLAEVRG